MSWQPHRLAAVLLFGLAATGCSLNPENGSSRSSALPNSYIVNGKRYQILHGADGFVQRGTASWYGRKFHGKRTSSGEPYDMYAMTAAHKRLPIPCRVEVTNLANGRHVIVRINDRGPFVGNRIIDLSYEAAKQLGMLSEGTAPVEIRALSAKPTTAPSQLASADPETSTAAAVSAAAATQRDAPFYIQVGAFTDRTNAYRLQGQLEAAKLLAPVQVEPFEEGGNKYYRVRLGPLRSRDAAGQLTRELAEYGVSDARTIDPY
ncbi:MAG TPA: septal ring lytic transglycosylase RlpA family protein [Nitrococcus sp.]|nr:septal ring lytic transglycosylase RlpA family protein [Nitrococcus sp.]